MCWFNYLYFQPVLFSIVANIFFSEVVCGGSGDKSVKITRPRLTGMTTGMTTTTTTSLRIHNHGWANQGLRTETSDINQLLTAKCGRARAKSVLLALAIPPRLAASIFSIIAPQPRLATRTRCECVSGSRSSRHLPWTHMHWSA